MWDCLGALLPWQKWTVLEASWSPRTGKLSVDLGALSFSYDAADGSNKRGADGGQDGGTTTSSTKTVTCDENMNSDGVTTATYCDNDAPLVSLYGSFLDVGGQNFRNRMFTPKHSRLEG